MINLGWNIVKAHLLKIKVPEFLLVLRVFDVLEGESTAPIVSKPDIVTFSRQKEGGCFVCTVQDPVISATLDSVLHENWLEWSSKTLLQIESVHGEKVPIFGLHLVLLKHEAVLFDDL